jgi:hypothetical protein
MREVVTAARVSEFMRRLGRAGTRPISAFLARGVSATLEGWRGYPAIDPSDFRRRVAEVVQGP